MIFFEQPLRNGHKINRQQYCLFTTHTHTHTHVTGIAAYNKQAHASATNTTTGAHITGKGGAAEAGVAVVGGVVGALVHQLLHLLRLEHLAHRARRHRAELLARRRGGGTHRLLDVAA